MKEQGFSFDKASNFEFVSINFIVTGIGKLILFPFKVALCCSCNVNSLGQILFRVHNPLVFSEKKLHHVYLIGSL